MKYLKKTLFLVLLIVTTATYGNVKQYNQWLESIELNKIVEAVDFVKTSTGNLLIFKPTKVDDPSTFIYNWIASDSVFQRLNSFKIDEVLFYGATNYFDVESNKLTIQIYLECDDSSPCFNINLSRPNGKFVRIGPVLRSYNSQSEFASLLSDTTLSSKLIMKSIKIGKDSVTKKIIEGAKQYFIKKGLDIDKHFSIKETEPNLIFNVWNLKGEILDGEFIKPRELITYFIKIVSNDNGIEINSMLIGKYASAVWDPGLNGYTSMNQRYQNQLRYYISSFSEERVRKWIEVR